MILKLLSSYGAIVSKLFAYSIRGILFGIFYGLSFVFPFFKNIINEFEKETSIRSILFIDFFSTSLVTILLVSIVKRLSGQIQDTIFSIFLFYFIWIVFGYFALLALSGIKKNKQPGTRKKPKNTGKYALKKSRKKKKKQH